MFRSLPLRCFFLFFALKLQFLSCQIRPLLRMEEMQKEIVPKTLIFFDLDDTLFKESSCSRTGTKRAKEWLQAHVNDPLFEKRYCLLMEDDSNSRPTSLWERFLFAPSSESVLVEEKTPQLLRRLNEQGCTIVALTARVNNDPHLWDLLLDFGYAFHAFTSFKLPTINAHAITYERGVFFADLYPKGKLLKCLMESVATHYPKVIFVDNNWENCLSVQEQFPEAVIFHYLAAETQFNPKIALIQYNHFQKQGVILSDEQASDLLHMAGFFNDSLDF